MKTLLYISAVLLVFTSCKDIIAEDITDETPVLILPLPLDTISVNPVHFKWDEMEGASRYHLMVVSPGFSVISEYVLDTIITGTEFFYDLDSNEYELKLIGQNAGYESQVLGPIKFYTGATITSSGTSVALASPSDGAYINTLDNNEFTWNPLNGSSSYEISIRQGTSFATGTIIDPQNNISTTSYTSPVSYVEGEYQWGVKSYLQSGGETDFSIYTLYIDTTTPVLPVLGVPGHQTSEFSGVITFTWNNGTDNGVIQSPVTSLFEISTDVGFATLYEPAQLIQGSTVDVNLPFGTYYWRITNTDEAGNSSAPSLVNQLTVN